MGLAEAVLAFADEVEKDASDIYPDGTNPLAHNVLVGYAQTLRLMVKASSAPIAKPIDSIPTIPPIPTDRGSLFIGVPPHVEYENKIKEIDQKAKEVALKRELRDKEDLGLACLRQEQGNRLAFIYGGPLDGEWLIVDPSVPVGQKMAHACSTGSYLYELKEDRNYHLVDPKP